MQKAKWQRELELLNGASNITSVKNALDFLNFEYSIVKKPDELANYSKVILPGVGSFKYAIDNLVNSGIANQLENFLSYPTNKLLGICLGMQLL